ncbi:uncharacterized protein [Drosophila virilis]|uniref:Uncharacterized protein n=1 Tax=Drosophila virilis TaxID=7244 RepID=B4MFM7_DROVI|nr:uncharacterized protein LOC6636404 [Drosophila virilis]EDW57198.1 uncharacterized protein Dvir_GJ15076 [Drosophila virilis]
MWTAAALLVLCLFCQLTLVPATPAPIWSLDQVGSYFNGIFRSIVGPLFGFGNDDARNTTPSN